MNDRFTDLDRIFEEALELPEGARPGFLAERCTDPGVRAEIERLLENASGAGTLLPPAAALTDLATVYGGLDEAERLILRALAIAEKNFGPEHSDFGSALVALGRPGGAEGGDRGPRSPGAGSSRPRCQVGPGAPDSTRGRRRARRLSEFRANVAAPQARPSGVGLASGRRGRARERGRAPGACSPAR